MPVTPIAYGYPQSLSRVLCVRPLHFGKQQTFATVQGVKTEEFLLTLLVAIE
jgi:hypothetical protein